MNKQLYCKSYVSPRAKLYYKTGDNVRHISNNRGKDKSTKPQDRGNETSGHMRLTRRGRIAAGLAIAGVFGTGVLTGAQIDRLKSVGIECEGSKIIVIGNEYNGDEINSIYDAAETVEGSEKIKDMGPLIDKIVNDPENADVFNRNPKYTVFDGDGIIVPEKVWDK